MKLSPFFKSISSYVIKHSPNILTIFTATGVVTTGILAAKEACIAKERLEALDAQYGMEFKHNMRDNPEVPFKDKVKAVLPVYIPAITVGGATIACAIGSNRISAKRNAVVASLYSASEVAAREYHDKVVEMLGEKKEREIRDAVSKDRIDNNPISKNQVVIVGNGQHLCYDAWSGRYFMSDIEKIRRIGNWAIEELKSNMYLTVNELYFEIGLDGIGNGNRTGWDVDDISLKDDFFDFSSQISDDGRPCLVIDFHVMPDARI